jgi:quercetin dioxygenase-like cupin family protein
MKNGNSITEQPLIMDNRLFNVSVLNFNLPLLINVLKFENASKNGEPITKILLNSRKKKIVLTILNENTEIDSFQGNDSVTIQIIKGELEFRTRKESIIIHKGQFLRLHEKVEYVLKNYEETIFIITLIMSPLISNKKAF